MTVPLLLLYEIGFAGSVFISRRRAGRADCGRDHRAHRPASRSARDHGRSPGAVPAKRRPPTAAGLAARFHPPGPETPRGAGPVRWTPRRPGGWDCRPAPSRSFAPARFRRHRAAGPPRLSGYAVPRRFSHGLHAGPAGLLRGKALTERRGSTLEADTITYRSASCLLDASGEPKLFDRGQVTGGAAHSLRHLHPARRDHRRA